jgi:hypothetical protein
VTAVFNKQAKRFESLWSQREDLSIANQSALDRIEAVFTELKDKCSIFPHKH